MNFKFENKKISGILVVLPGKESKFDDEIDNYNFPRKNSLKLKKVIGFNKHRIVEENTCSSDLCIWGMNYLFENEMLNKDEIDALILITETPDYFMPPTSNVIQGKLGLKNDIICMDINQGCAGFLVGLIQAFLLLDQETVMKVVLLNADTLTRKISKKDRNTYPLMGDGASVTIIEKSEVNNTIFANIKMDGTRYKELIIPAGGFRLPSTPETAEMIDVGDGNMRSQDNYHMDGISIFNFVQTDIPPLIDSLIDFSGISKDEIDYYMFHQPNKFILKKLADKMGVTYDKMPNNVVENFGNSSGVTIPTAIVFNLAKELLEKSYKMCLCGFGVGLSWSSMLIEIGNLNFCKMIDYG